MHPAQCLITTQCYGWLGGFVEHVEVRIDGGTGSLARSSAS
jgi:hypothetical protein